MTSIEKKKICVIDDEAPIRNVLSKALSEQFDVKGFESAEQALSEDLIQFDVVLADVRLPGKSGIELISEIRNIDDSLPVILMTGMSDFNTAVSALREGASDFIVKPFIMEQLLVSVNRAIERRILVKENLQLFKELADKNTQLEELNKVINARNIQMESDVDFACNLLESLFPRVFPEIPGVSFSLKMTPYEKISGDFFEVFPMNGKKFMFILADVCGHGVPAALYSALIKSTIMVQKEGALSTADFITKVNEYLISSHKMLIYTYVAIFCAVFDPEQGSVTYCNAGIPAPLFLSESGEVSRLESTGTVVGIFKGAVFQETKIPLNDGDRMLLFTDGAFEGLPVPSALKGYDNLAKFIDSKKNEPLYSIVDMIYGRLFDESGKTIIRDDVTIVGIDFSL